MKRYEKELDGVKFDECRECPLCYKSPSGYGCVRKDRAIKRVDRIPKWCPLEDAEETPEPTTTNCSHSKLHISAAIEHLKIARKALKA